MGRQLLCGGTESLPSHGSLKCHIRGRNATSVTDTARLTPDPSPVFTLPLRPCPSPTGSRAPSPSPRPRPPLTAAQRAPRLLLAGPERGSPGSASHRARERASAAVHPDGQRARGAPPRTTARAAGTPPGPGGEAAPPPAAAVPGAGPGGAATGPRGPGQARPGRGGAAASATSALPAPGAGRRGGAAPLKGPAGPHCHPHPPRRAERAGGGGGRPNATARAGAGRGQRQPRPSAALRAAGRGRPRHASGGKVLLRGPGDSPRPRLRGRWEAAGGGSETGRACPEPDVSTFATLARPRQWPGERGRVARPSNSDRSGATRPPRPGGGLPAAGAPRADPALDERPPPTALARTRRKPSDRGDDVEPPAPRRSPSPPGGGTAPQAGPPTPHAPAGPSVPASPPPAGAARPRYPAAAAGHHRPRPHRRGRTPALPPLAAPSAPCSERPPPDFARPGRREVGPEFPGGADMSVPRGRKRGRAGPGRAAATPPPRQPPRRRRGRGAAPRPP